MKIFNVCDQYWISLDNCIVSFELMATQCTYKCIIRHA